MVSSSCDCDRQWRSTPVHIRQGKVGDPRSSTLHPHRIHTDRSRSVVHHSHMASIIESSGRDNRFHLAISHNPLWIFHGAGICGKAFAAGSSWLQRVCRASMGAIPDLDHRGTVAFLSSSAQCLNPQVPLAFWSPSSWNQIIVTWTRRCSYRWKCFWSHNNFG